MTDVSSGESEVNTVSLHSCSCLRYPSLVTLFVPVEHLESWHRSSPMWPLHSQMAQLGMTWTSLKWLGPELDKDELNVIMQEASIRRPLWSMFCWHVSRQEHRTEAPKHSMEHFCSHMLWVAKLNTLKSICFKAFFHPFYFKYTPGYLQIDLKTLWMRWGP